ncbi:MAG: toprim domain-containing protein [Microscillaceae bacterium]|jgi:hypothetical protein|nr:toprim domain-containing protein [Microscillaceae bacterium]
MTRKEQFYQARQLDLEHYVENRLGLRFSHARGLDRWYFSPFAPEQKTASFHIHAGRNIWKDFAIDSKGGDIVNLVALLNRCDLYGALDWIFNNRQTLPLSPIIRQSEPENKPIIEIRKIQALQNKALIDYILSRKISLDIAKVYLSEIYYRKGEKNYFGVSMANDLGGYEVSSKIGKICIGSKGITIIAGNSKSCFLFEGMFDFLSYLVWLKLNNQASRNSTIIIIHSVSMLNKAIDYLKTQNFEYISAFFDNDLAGQKALQKLLTQYPDTLDCAPIFYPNHKDFNDLLLNKTLENI